MLEKRVVLGFEVKLIIIILIVQVIGRVVWVVEWGVFRFTKITSIIIIVIKIDAIATKRY